MKIFLITTGIFFLLGVAFFLSVFGQMIFVAEITDRKAKKDKDCHLLLEGVRVTELEHKMPPLDYEFRPGTGAMPPAAKALLSPENKIAEGQRFFDSDPSQPVLWLKTAGSLADKIFLKNDVYGVDEDDAVAEGDSINEKQLGVKIASFDNPPLGVLRHIGALNHQYFLLIGDHHDSPYADAKLWLVDHTTYKQILLSEDPYYSFSRPPKIFKPEGLDGEVLVYYVGSLDWGFGGNSSRPQYSVVRLFSDAYPQGIDLVKFAFKAGTIVEVEFRDKALILTGDPTVPLTKDRLPPRLWQVDLPAGIVPI